MNEPAVIRLAIENDTLSGQQKYNAQHALAILESRIPKWQTIETAPKDEAIWVRMEHWITKTARHAELIHVDADDRDWVTADDESELSISWNPTHWQPLPDQPTEAK